MSGRVDSSGRPFAGVARRVAVVLAGLAALLGVGLGVAPAASAHASLLFTTPGVGTSVASPPTVLTLIFDQPVGLSGRTVSVSGVSEAAVALGGAVRDRAGSVVTVPVRQRLAPGVYTVSWQVVAQDGDVVTGSYQVAVGPAIAAGLSSGGVEASVARGQVATTAARWLVFAALALIWGEVVGARLVRRHARDGGPRPRSWALPAAGAGALASVVLAVLIAGDGSVAFGLVRPAFGLLAGRAGTLSLVEAGAFVCSALLAWLRPRWAWLPLVAVVGAEGWRAHPQAFAPGWGLLVTAGHLTAAALWAGTLVYVVRCLVVWRSTARWALLAGYARLAGWLFAAVLATGVWAALIVVPPSALLTTGYGQLLLVKAVLVAGVAGCALVARARLGRRRERGLPSGWVRVESVALAFVVAMAALLTVAAPPRVASGALPVAPPPSGPVVPVGARAGLIGIGVQASAGQLVVRLSAPGADRPGADAGYRLAVTVAAPSGGARTLVLRGCGTGCFAAPVPWQTGTSQLTLRADSREWPGGSTSVEVPWPPADGTKTLERTAQLLRGLGRFSLYEQATSIAGGAAGAPQALPLTGAQFLNAEPYSGGLATYADFVPGPGGTATLLLGFPAEQVQVSLALDTRGRPVRETLTDPNHLVQRSFVYPEEG